MDSTIFTVNLPDIGEGVAEGEVIEWLKQVGDTVKQDEPVVVVMTDKATVELPAPYPGTISKHYFQAGETAFRNKPLYEIQLKEDSSSTQPNAVLTATEKPLGGKEIQTKAVAPHQPCPSKSNEKVLATPQVRHLAKTLGINLKGIVGSGNHGQITVEDIQLHSKVSHQGSINHPSSKHQSSSCASSTLEGDEQQVLHGVRRQMAKKMAETHIPQFSYFESTDATMVMKLRREMNKREMNEREMSENGKNGSPSIGFMPFFIRALSLVAKEYPLINSSIDGELLTIHKQQNIGIAVAGPQGLIVPVIKGVQDMDFPQIVQAFQALKDKIAANRLSPDEMGGATITISNFGTLGNGLYATPMITSPQVAILAVAKIRQVPAVINGTLSIQDQLPLSWSFDHRVIDGELAAKFSHLYCQKIENFKI